ncbi:ABC transporter permease [Micromonospora sp. WMMD1102]|uniref:ABC transporter permease n=1 Tax=Micromonospora sp. WMMD1102 TaxID=3016105 RepID=UPI0024154489|nr:ABC transporter permease [Micromonospora sp. WMMD1102]MDG4791482.1 ABC transporter permease [Micromonospora sp. WMMD1102]
MSLSGLADDDTAAPPWHGSGFTATLRREWLLLTRDRVGLLLAAVPAAVYIALLATSLADLAGTVTYRGRTVGYPDFVIPGLVFAALLGAATASGTALCRERAAGMALELWSYPLTRWQYVAGKLLAGSALVFGQAVAALAVSAALFGSRWPAERWAALLCGLLLAALAFTALGLLLGTVVRERRRYGVLVNVLVPVLLFGSPAFYPVEHLGPAQRVLADANPVSHGVAALRAALLDGFAGAWPHLVLLGAVAVVAAAGAGRRLVRESRAL